MGDRRGVSGYGELGKFAHALSGLLVYGHVLRIVPLK
jgi:hypothetical protein